MYFAEVIFVYVSRALRDLGRECKIQTDLGGHKLRTGALQSAGRFLRIRPERDIRGTVVAPARVWLTLAETLQAAPAGVANTLQMPREFLRQSKPGDVLRFSDTRGKKRAARIVSSDGESRLAELTNTAYIEEGLVVTLRRNKEQIGAAQFSGLPSATVPLQLAVGDRLLLTRSDEPGRTAVRDFNGQVISPARIPCTLKEAFDAVKPGERVWFDDGKIGGMVTGNDGAVITVEITHTNLKGGRLRAERGINLPDTDLNIPALTDKDLADLESVVQFADIIGLSFVRAPEDVFSFKRQRKESSDGIAGQAQLIP